MAKGKILHWEIEFELLYEEQNFVLIIKVNVNNKICNFFRRKWSINDLKNYANLKKKKKIRINNK